MNQAYNDIKLNFINLIRLLFLATSALALIFLTRINVLYLICIITSLGLYLDKSVKLQLDKTFCPILYKLSSHSGKFQPTHQRQICLWDLLILVSLENRQPLRNLWVPQLQEDLEILGNLAGLFLLWLSFQALLVDLQRQVVLMDLENQQSHEFLGDLQDHLFT